VFYVKIHHNNTYLRVWVTYRRVLDWWPDLCTLIQLVTTLHKPYNTLCLLFSVIFDSLLKRLPQLFLNYSIILIPQSNHSAGLGSSLYRLGEDPQKTPSLSNSSIVGPCRGNVFTANVPRNGHLLCPTIPTFRRHVTITFHLQFMLSQHWYANQSS
jgi:hypothetical protein